MKSGPKKPKLENETLAHWCVANNAILYRLICESELNPNNMLDYISYSTKFVNWFNVLPWCQYYFMIGTIDMMGTRWF